MANHSTSRLFQPIQNRYKKRVRGLRDFDMPSEVRVYRANPDGSTGKLLRIENPENPKSKRGKR